MSIEAQIHRVLQTPRVQDPDGFDALQPDGSIKAGLSEQLVAAMARRTLGRCIPGVAFDHISVLSDASGRLIALDVHYMDEVHDPAPRSVTVEYRSS